MTTEATEQDMTLIHTPQDAQMILTARVTNVEDFKLPYHQNTTIRPDRATFTWDWEAGSWTWLGVTLIGGRVLKTGTVSDKQSHETYLSAGWQKDHIPSWVFELEGIVGPKTSPWAS